MQLVGPGNFTEVYRSQSEFTSQQFEDVKVALVSDLVNLPESLVGVFKTILGRDPISICKKYINGVTTVTPNCQLLVISNEPPINMPALRNEQALLDKFIVLNLETRHVIDPSMPV
jgi:hypothetical protein